MRVGVLVSHPVQYYSPWFRVLAHRVNLQVYYAYRPTPEQQGSGFGHAFTWDVDLLSGYPHAFLTNRATRPGTDHFFGCDTPEIEEVIRTGHFDAFIVSGWYLKCYWQAVRACKRNNIPVLVRGDSQLSSANVKLKEWLKRIIYPTILNQFAGFLAPGKRNAEYLQVYGIPRERIFHVPHCVDVQWFATQTENCDAERARLRRRLGDSTGERLVLFVGKLIHKKRPSDLLAAVARLTLLGEKVIGVFVGAGELREPLERQMQELQIDCRFEHFKNQTELPLYYASCAILVLPSESSETWGLVVNEAMACGTPAVVSDAVGCAPDLIEEGRTGFSYPVGNVDALAAKIADLLQRRRMGFDFASELRRKMQSYDLPIAAQNTLDAVQRTIKAQREQ